MALSICSVCASSLWRYSSSVKSKHSRYSRVSKVRKVFASSKSRCSAVIWSSCITPLNTVGCRYSASFPFRTVSQWPLSSGISSTCQPALRNSFRVSARNASRAASSDQPCEYALRIEIPISRYAIFVSSFLLFHNHVIGFRQKLFTKCNKQYFKY